MIPAIAREEIGIRSDLVLPHYDPDAFGKMLMNESFFQPSGVSYAARTTIVQSEVRNSVSDDEK